MQRASACRRRATSESFGAVLIVAITLALSGIVYTVVHVSLDEEPPYSIQSYSVYGSPSFVYVRINSSAAPVLDEVQIDRASSSDGILSLDSGGYMALRTLCSLNATTFFSVDSPAGVLSVNSNGRAWIDGTEGGSATVPSGWNEIVIAGASGCSLTLPGGEVVSYPSPLLSPIPISEQGADSILIVVPCTTGGHTLTATLAGAIEQIAF